MTQTQNNWVAQHYADHWWANADTIIDFCRRYAGTSVPKKSGDLLGLDFLNMGSSETARIAEHLHLNAHSVVLDVGSGLGGPARKIAADYHCSVKGIDLTQKQVESAIQLNRMLQFANSVQFQVASASKLPFENESFDAAYAIETLNHIHNKSDVLLEIARVLKPGARLVIEDYFCEAKDNSLQSIFPQGYHPWLREEILKATREAGFRILCSEDRSQEYACSYQEFHDAFNPSTAWFKKLKASMQIWMHDSLPLYKRINRFLGWARFMLHHRKSVKRFFNGNVEAVLNFARIQAHLCRENKLQYSILVLERA